MLSRLAFNPTAEFCGSAATVVDDNSVLMALAGKSGRTGCAASKTSKTSPPATASAPEIIVPSGRTVTVRTRRFANPVSEVSRVST